MSSSRISNSRMSSSRAAVRKEARRLMKQQKLQELYELKKEYIRAKDPSRPYEEIDEEAKKLNANDPGFQIYLGKKNIGQIEPLMPGKKKLHSLSDIAALGVIKKRKTRRRRKSTKKRKGKSKKKRVHRKRKSRRRS